MREPGHAAPCHLPSIHLVIRTVPVPPAAGCARSLRGASLNSRKDRSVLKSAARDEQHRICLVRIATTNPNSTITQHVTCERDSLRQRSRSGSTQTGNEEIDYNGAHCGTCVAAAWFGKAAPNTAVSPTSGGVLRLTVALARAWGWRIGCGLTARKFRLEKRIGSGGFGSICAFRARLHADLLFHIISPHFENFVLLVVLGELQTLVLMKTRENNLR